MYCHSFCISILLQYCNILSLFLPLFLQLPLLYCPAAALPLLNRSSSKSLFALYFSNQAVAAQPRAGQCVQGSQWQARRHGRVRWYPRWPARRPPQPLSRLPLQPELMLWLRRCRQGGLWSCPRSWIDVLLPHHVLGICQKPMSAIQKQHFMFAWSTFERNVNKWLGLESRPNCQSCWTQVTQRPSLDRQRYDSMNRASGLAGWNLEITAEMESRNHWGKSKFKLVTAGICDNIFKYHWRLI